MGRGSIYYITDDKEDDGSHFAAYNYYNREDIMGVDYVKDLRGADARAALECLKGKMQQLGASAEYFNGTLIGYEDESIAFSFRFDKVEAMLMDYFRPKLEKLKANAKALTLPDVIRSAPSLDFICNNDASDLIELNRDGCACLLTVDDFIRQVEPGITYYACSHIVLMH